jgi:glycosyltransferase involved in cell wall biosynthesis
MCELFTVIITTYECYGKGKELLEENINSILTQTYENIECVITDHSKDDIIENYIKTVVFPNNINFVYTRYTENYGSPSHNWNNGIKHANGDFLHTLCMDERYSNPNAIKNIVKFMKSTNSKWVACSQTVEPTNYKFTPKWNNNILKNNTLSGNGAIVITKELKHILFDSQFIWYLDTDYYYRISLEVGPPNIFDEICYIGRIHENQLTSKVCDDTRRNNELQLLKNKYPTFFSRKHQHRLFR